MECADMSALRSEATCRLGKTPPKKGALQIALFGGLETPKVFASGRPLLPHVDPSTAREVDRPLRRAIHLHARRESGAAFSGAKISQKNSKNRIAFILEASYKRD